MKGKSLWCRGFQIITGGVCSFGHLVCSLESSGPSVVRDTQGHYYCGDVVWCFGVLSLWLAFMTLLKMS
jgi:hypothetical protein